MCKNEECGKCGVWKMRRKFQFSISISVEMGRNSVLTIKKKEKEKNAMNHFIMRCAGLGW